MDLKKYINIKALLLLIPFIYSISRLKNDVLFYVISSTIFILIFIIYLFKDDAGRKRVLSKYLNIKFWFSISISFIFIDLIFHNLENFSGLLKAFNNVRWDLFIGGVFLWIILMIFRAYRWKYVLSNLKKVSFISRYSATSIGYLGNFILPFRMGELLRAYILKEREKIKFSSILTTIFVERVFDGISMIVMVFIFFIINPLSNTTYNKYIYIGVFFYIIAVAVFLLSYFFKDFFKKILSFFLPQKIVNLFNDLIDSIHDGLKIVGDSKRLFMYTILTFINWAMIISCYIIFLVSYNLHTILPGYSLFFISILMNIFINVGVTLPSAPGFIGSFQFAILASLGLLNTIILNKSTLEYAWAVNFSWAVWAAQAIPIYVIGFIFLISGGFSLIDFMGQKNLR